MTNTEVNEKNLARNVEMVYMDIERIIDIYEGIQNCSYQQLTDLQYAEKKVYEKIKRLLEEDIIHRYEI